jgi:hypothetical protein
MLLWRSLSLIGSAALAMLLLSGATDAQEAGSVTPLETMHVVVHGIGSDTTSFDISWVDQSTGQYFLADRTNNAVDQFDAAHDRFVGFLGQGAFHATRAAACLTMGASDSADCNGPNGVVTDDHHRVWVSDGVSANSPESNIKVLAAPPATGVIATIPTGGTFRSDELSYDPQDQIILLANPDFGDAFLTWIDVKKLTVAGTFHYVPASKDGWGGLEQSVYDPVANLFYQAVPGVADESGNVVTRGAIDVFAPLPVDGQGQRVASWKVADCLNGPTGLTRTADNTLVGACDNGAVIVKLPGGDEQGMIPSDVGGADEVWFNPGDGNVYLAMRSGGPGNSGELGVVGGSNITGILQTGAGAHSVAAYIGNNHIFVPVAGGGVKVFSAPLNP